MDKIKVERWPRRPSQDLVPNMAWEVIIPGQEDSHYLLPTQHDAFIAACSLFTPPVGYVLFYTSADGPEDDATWSVYREEYPTFEADEPIEGRTFRVCTFGGEQQASRAAARMQREFIQVVRVRMTFDIA